MEKEKQFSDYKKLSLQDVADLCECSVGTAQKIKREIKKDLGICTKYIFYFQFRAYFCQISTN
ncbi:hypothetical protein [Elizabethkingia ursingii]|uniref:hypothetical protein n=1 Tax=Elizabethkingia ursingii TaxID=1756150 RepID=UPI0007516D3F|nr:hypothetical protein [Elizabethkingia ursingii]KUY26564.1 hypothetical protein ATB96_05145 [Elizabethkingia ursingii]